MIQLSFLLVSKISWVILLIQDVLTRLYAYTIKYIFTFYYFADIRENYKDIYYSILQPIIFISQITTRHQQEGQPPTDHWLDNRAVLPGCMCFVEGGIRKVRYYQSRTDFFTNNYQIKTENRN